MNEATFAERKAALAVLIESGVDPFPPNAGELSPLTGLPEDYPGKIQDLSLEQRTELAAVIGDAPMHWAQSLKTLCMDG